MKRKQIIQIILMALLITVICGIIVVGGISAGAAYSYDGSAYMTIFIAILLAVLLVISILLIKIAKDRKVIAKQSLTLQASLDIMTSILNKSAVMIYVTDSKTDEIIFINDMMKRHFMLDDNVIGKPCYTILQKGMTERCDFCPNRLLDIEPDKVIVWEDHNSITNQFYQKSDQYVDWPDGRKVHIQHCINITDIKQSNEKLKSREDMMEALNKTAIILLSQTTKSFDEVISSGIRQIVDLFDIDRFSFFRNYIMPDGLHAKQVYRWDRVSGGASTTTDQYSNGIYAEFAPNWERILRDGNVVNGPAQLMPAEEAATMKAAGSVSVFIVPVFSNDIFWGFAMFEDRRNERQFDDDSAEIMRSAAFLCSNVLIRHEMEQEINKVNERAKILLDKTPLTCQLFDANYKKIDCNEETIRLFGFKNKQEYLEKYFELYPEYQDDGMRSDVKIAMYLKKAFEEGSCSFKWTYKMLDGTFMPAEVICVRVNYEDNYVVAGYTRDLREHEKMMQSIYYRDNLLNAVNSAASVLLTANDSETFNDALLESMEIIGNGVDVDCVEIWQNEMINGELHAVIKHYWFNEKAHYGESTPVLQSFPYSDTPDWENRLSGGEYIRGSISNLSPEDQDFINPFGIKSLLVIPVFFENRLWGMCCIDDYTKYREFSEEEVGILHSCCMFFVNALLRNDMVQKIKDTSVQLGAALEQAKAASKAKGDFLSAMSHEMRTPMNAIIGMTTIAKRTNNLKEKDHALSKIGDASSHLLSVINDVLDMAKIEANKLELTPVEFNFERMLQKVTTVVNFRVDEKRQKFSTNIDGNIPNFLIGDDHRLAQVITNLLSNAIKFTPEGGHIQLNASLLGETDEDCELRIEVIDSGIGIDPQQHDKLFGMFEQAESGISREYGGTGLGLVISKNIIELMNGRIWLESKLGKGAKFIFTIKAKRGTKNPRSLLSPNVNWKNIRILAVDDMVEIHHQFMDIFNTLDIKCDVAFDGFEACKMIEENGEYDVYFVDWRMPGMDGIELTKKIKSRVDGRQSVVIMITAMDWEQIREEAMRVGVDKHLLKPLFSSMIIDCINECLGVSAIDEDEHKDILFTGKRILLAEDIEINREIFIALLENTALVIDCVENGKEALETIEAAHDKYDIIFMDIHMPKMDGLEATRLIRAFEAEQNAKNENLHLHIPIIAMTANVFKDDVDKCIAAGMDGHLGKPIDIEKVIDVLGKYLGKS